MAPRGASVARMAGWRASATVALGAQIPVFASCPELYYSSLRDGDVVFFPAYWYHYFHNVTGSITVTTQSCRHD